MANVFNIKINIDNYTQKALIYIMSQELLKETRQEWANRAVELLYSIFCLDTQQITLTLLGTILPELLTDSAHWQSLADPPGKALAK